MFDIVLKSEHDVRFEDKIMDQHLRNSNTKFNFWVQEFCKLTPNVSNPRWMQLLCNIIAYV